jgi:putative membrane protein
MMGPMMGPYGFGSGWWWMGGWLMMLVFWALVIAGIVVLIRFATSAAPRRGGAETPLEILRRRYAAGELTKEQFEQMKRDVA